MGQEKEREMEIDLSLNIDAKEEEEEEEPVLHDTEEAAEATAGEVDDDASVVEAVSLQQNMKTEEVHIFTKFSYAYIYMYILLYIYDN